jgi:hypothetical protein
MIERNGFVSKYVMYPQAILSVEAHLILEQFLSEEQTINIDSSLIYRSGARRPPVSKRERQNLEPRQTLIRHNASR